MRLQRYGDEITSTSNDREKFATYTRDSYTGLDYAQQRFYASTYGNFTSPDPSMDNVDYQNPLSWNAYAYVNGDPMNANDPSGLDTVSLPSPQPNIINCSTNFIYSAALGGETINQLFNSNQGVLAMMSFFEQGGTGTTQDQNVWAALDWTMENLYNLSPTQKTQFYGSAANVPATFVATVTANSQVFSGGQLTPGFSTSLLNILTGPVNSSPCNGLIDAFNVAAGVIASANNLTIPGITPIPDPVPGALQFGSNGAVPGHGSSFTQGVVSTLQDTQGGVTNTWTFYSETYNPPRPVRRPPPPRRGKGPL